MKIFDTIYNLIVIIVDGIVSVISYVSFLITNVFNLFTTFINYITNSLYVIDYLPSDISPFINVIISIIIITFVVSAVTWVVHLVRG